jgi:Na+/H+ antiporter NhaD/arsenite permease-like protein
MPFRTVSREKPYLIVVKRAAGSGVAISFWDYFRVGAPLTIITLAIGTLWLWL